ncbi:hypothetical protein NUACC26_071430 [Scytonema sp. NUACC26]
MTFEEHLAYDDETDKHYEFEGGELVEIPPESPLNSRIARFLFAISIRVTTGIINTQCLAVSIMLRQIPCILLHTVLGNPI